jgi:hypothetical protein
LVNQEHLTNESGVSPKVKKKKTKNETFDNNNYILSDSPILHLKQ